MTRDLAARVRALASDWQERADTSRDCAVAREGLSDADALTDYSATMSRRAADLRALLDSPDTEPAEDGDDDALLRLVQAAIQAHRDLHVIYGSTTVCSGGIGGQAMTQHCGVTCAYHERHEDENAAWYDVESAYFRRQEGDPEWADYIPGGRLSSRSLAPANDRTDR